jgi:hypothetical protein
MSDLTTSSVRVHYKEDGSLKTKTIKFKGNFGFSLDGKQYKTQNGSVYNAQGQKVAAITMPRATAYQFIGMSNNAELAYDLTYSEKDIKQAQYDHEQTYGSRQLKVSGVPYADTKSATIIGKGAGKVVEGSTQCEKGVYTTKYKSKDDKKVHTVSIWLNK